MKDLIGKKDLYKVTSIMTSKGEKPTTVLSVKIDTDCSVQVLFLFFFLLFISITAELFV